MGKRWELVAALAIAFALLCPLVAAHKNPIVEYAYVGHLWEEAYTTAPRQPVIDERVVFKLSVEHPSDAISGNVTGLLSVYRDDTRYEWYGGESYKRPDWLIMKEAWLAPEGNNRFMQDIVISEPGSYHVLVDWYENGQYIGQSMHALDIEQRTLGPLFLIFSALITSAVLLGVWRGVL
jgi:hypothetical protein